MYAAYHIVYVVFALCVCVCAGFTALSPSTRRVPPPVVRPPHLMCVCVRSLSAAAQRRIISSYLALCTILYHSVEHTPSN